MSGMELFIREYSISLLEKLSEEYNFDLNEAKSKFLEIKINIVESSGKKSKVKEEKKPNYFPYCGKIVNDTCFGLSLNNGLMTQCKNKKIEGDFCRRCKKTRTEDIPALGTIQMRSENLFNYVSPNGKKQEPYTKIMKKLKLSRAEIEEAAKKFNVVINPLHFTDNSSSSTSKKSKQSKIEQVNPVSDSENETKSETKYKDKPKNKTSVTKTPPVVAIKEDTNPIQKPSEDAPKTLKVVKVKCQNGMEYFKAGDGSVYDKVTKQIVGKWNNETKDVDFLKNDDHDNEEEEEEEE